MNTGEVLVAVDVGTSGARAAAFDLSGRPAGLLRRRFATSIPRDGWAEQDAASWRSAALSALGGLIRALGPGRAGRPGAADYERLDHEAAGVPAGADGLLFIPVLRVPGDATAAGVAMLAGLGVGAYRTADEAVAAACHPADPVLPDPAHRDTYDALYTRYLKVLASDPARVGDRAQMRQDEPSGTPVASGAGPAALAPALREGSALCQLFKPMALTCITG